MTTAFQPGAFQSDAFQQDGGTGIANGIYPVGIPSASAFGLPALAARIAAQAIARAAAFGVPTVGEVVVVPSVNLGGASAPPKPPRPAWQEDEEEVMLTLALACELVA